MNARSLVVACVVVAAGAAHSAQVCRWTTAEGTAAFGPTLPPGTRGQCDGTSAPGPALADNPLGQQARPSDRLRADIEARANALAAKRAAAGAPSVAQRAAQHAMERAADPRDQSIETLILRARAHRAAAR